MRRASIKLAISITLNNIVGHLKADDINYEISGIAGANTKNQASYLEAWPRKNPADEIRFVNRVKINEGLARNFAWALTISLEKYP